MYKLSINPIKPPSDGHPEDGPETPFLSPGHLLATAPKISGISSSEGATLRGSCTEYTLTYKILLRILSQMLSHHHHMVVWL